MEETTLTGEAQQIVHEHMLVYLHTNRPILKDHVTVAKRLCGTIGLETNMLA